VQAPARRPCIPEPLRVRVLLFGAFREIADGGELWLAVPRGSTVADLRRHLREALGGSQARAELVDRFALASDDGILLDAQPLGHGADEVRVAILPPVYGDRSPE
jgi:molybdopterin converting factor small subunit